jgi:ABC-type branched-subunit amino acid transport system substrate-binding protein
LEPAGPSVLPAIHPLVAGPLLLAAATTGLKAPVPLPPIRLGQSAPLSGPSAQLGQEYREGAQAYFAQVNREGGVFGRRIELISRDDRYEPPRTIANTRALLDQDRVFALFGYVGTPTTQAILPLVEARRVPLIAPLSGAQLLRHPPRTMVFNLRPSYQRELDQSISYLVRSGRHRIAVVYQADAYGQDGLVGARRALRRHGLEPVATAAVQRNSLRNGAAASRIAEARPNGVVLVTAYGTAADLIRRLHRLGSRAQVMNVSFVGTRALRDALPPTLANGIGVSQVVPFPWDGRLPVVRDYQRLMRRQQRQPQFGFSSLEGFLAAKVTVEALRRAGPRLDRLGFIAAMESLRSTDLGGFRVSFAPGDHEGSDLVELTFLGSQHWEP